MLVFLLRFILLLWVMKVIPEKIQNDVVFKTEACPVSGFSFQGFPHPG